MGELVSLRRERKRRKRAADAAVADQNRLVHGRTRAERDAAKTQTERTARLLDGHRRDRDGEAGD